MSESDYSFSSGQRTEGEEDTESEIEDDENEKTWMLLKKIKAENRQLKSSLNEANDEKEELLSNLDKLCEEFDALKENYDKLEEEHATLSEKAKQDKHSLQTRLRGVELDRDNLKDSLREIQDEKLALLKCLEMRNTEPMSPLSPLPQPLLDKIITQAQSFTQEEHKSNEPTSNEEYSDASSSSDEEEEEKVSVPQTSTESGTDLEKEPDATSNNAKDKELASLVAAIENDLGKLKERLAKGESNAQGKINKHALIYKLDIFLLLKTSSNQEKSQIFLSLPTVNHSTPEGDQHLISPYNIIPESQVKGHKKKGNDHQLKKLLIVIQILLFSTLGNVSRTVWRI